MEIRPLKSFYDRPTVVAVIVGVLSVLSLKVSSQAPSSTNVAKPTFDVASITQNKSGEANSRMGFQPGGRFIASNVTLCELMRIAFGGANPLYEFQIVGGPNWITSARFDVQATANTGASDPDRRQRLRTLRRGTTQHQQFSLQCKNNSDLSWNPRSAPLMFS